MLDFKGQNNITLVRILLGFIVTAIVNECHCVVPRYLLIYTTNLTLHII
jgi:hypothetical protein